MGCHPPLSWKQINYNPNITPAIIESNPDLWFWDWDYLSGSGWFNYNDPSQHQAAWSLIKTLQHKPWNWAKIMQRPKIEWSVVKALPDKPWNWNTFIKVGTDGYIIYKTWDWDTVSDSADFVIDNIKDLSHEYGLSWQVVQDNPYAKWNWYIISENPDMLKLTLNEKMQHLACLRIQRIWRKCTSDPAYSLCKRRLLKDFMN